MSRGPAHERAAEAAGIVGASWRHLAFLNYRAEASLLEPRLPRGTELDSWGGHPWLSVVGLLFLDMTVLGLPVPFHGRFEQVNLRFYVRRRHGDGWRRGVVFVKEIVPRAALAFLARSLFGERYAALPMAHELGRPSDSSGTRSVGYSFEDGRTNRLTVASSAEPGSPAPGSHEAFIVERYWGYTRRSASRTLEIQVRHPAWLVAAASQAELDCDVSRVYGPTFAAALGPRPDSAFLAEGSDVTISRPVVLPG